MDRAQKSQLVNDLKENLSQSTIAIITRQSGLTVDEVSDLRGRVRQANENSSYKVMKNTLVRLAVAGGDYEPLKDHMTGPTAIACADEPVGIAKAIVGFAKDNERLEVIGGVMDGQLMSAADVNLLATLPSLDELRAMLIAVIQAPATKVARIAQAPATKLARVFDAYASK